MTLLDELRDEHALIEQVAASLRTFARRRCRGEAADADGAKFLRFFRLYAGAFHHEREEDILFVVLQRVAELPGDRGPIAALTADHREMAVFLDGMESSLEGDPEARRAFEAHALAYSERLFKHIDAENSVLLPESAARLARLGTAAVLPTPDATLEQMEARAEGERLLATYPPSPEPAILRGDGCIACPAYCRGCDGLEREWWNEWEWEEFEDHLPSG